MTFADNLKQALQLQISDAEMLQEAFYAIYSTMLKRVQDCYNDHHEELSKPNEIEEKLTLFAMEAPLIRRH